VEDIERVTIEPIPLSKRQLFEQKEAKRLESLVTSEYDSLVVLGLAQAVVPIITDAAQQTADEMGVPIGEVDKFYLQPPNRQYFRRAFKEFTRAERSTERDTFLKSIVHEPKAGDPAKLPDHLIHKIYKQRGISIRWKQHRIGYQWVHTDSDIANIKLDKTKCEEIRSWPLLNKILKRRGKLRAKRHEVEYATRRSQRAA
jgi:hypothetical protein